MELETMETTKSFRPLGEKPAFLNQLESAEEAALDYRQPVYSWGGDCELVGPYEVGGGPRTH